MNKVKELLDQEVCSRNNHCELSYDKPDPLLVASRYDDEYIILLYALFAYGNAKLIVKFKPAVYRARYGNGSTAPVRNFTHITNFGF